MLTIRLLIAIGVMLTWISHPVIAQESITISTPEGVYVPVVSQKVVQEAYKRIGITVKFLEQPGERAILEANNGGVDGALNRVQGVQNKYPNLIMIPVPINTMSIGVFTKNLSFPVTGWKSLRPYNVLIRRGIKAIETQLPKELNYIYVTHGKQIFLMLDLDRADLGIYPIVEGQLIARSLGFKNIKVLYPPLYSVELFHYIHKRHERLIPQITAILQQMDTQGEIQKIREQVRKALLQQ